MTLAVHARRRPDGALHVRHNLGTLDGCDLPAVFAALGADLGLDAEPLRKAVSERGGEGPDPRYPELITLVRAARRDWEGFGAQLVERVQALLRAGKLLPMTAESEAALLELFRDHEVRVLARFAGYPGPDLPRYRRLLAAGLVDHTVDASLIDVAFRLGRGLNALEHHRVKPAEAPPLADVLRAALAVPLTERDRAALEYTRRHGAIYMRRPIDQCTNAVHRALTDAELGAFRAATSEAIRTGGTGYQLQQALREAAGDAAGHPAVARARAQAMEKLEPELQEAMAARTLQNDMERVQRTELALAFSTGAYEALRQQTAAAGIADPEVYKFVSPRACSDCRRIWGPPRNPHRYRLSYVEAREAAGGNYGKPRQEWGPTVGPVHPNCFPAGVGVRTPAGEVPIEQLRVGALVLTHRGRWRRVSRTMQRPFSGRLVVVDGIPVTEDHPFLCRGRWVRARDLVLGDDLAEPSEIPLTDANHAPAIGDEVRFLARIGADLLRRGVPVSAIDLDRDFGLDVRQIDEIAMHLKPGREAYARLCEGIQEVLLQIGLDLSGLRSSHAHDQFIGLGLATGGSMSGFRHAGTLSRRALSSHTERDLRRGAARDPVDPHVAPDGGWIYPQQSRDLLFGTPLLQVEAANDGVIQGSRLLKSGAHPCGHQDAPDSLEVGAERARDGVDAHASLVESHYLRGVESDLRGRPHRDAPIGALTYHQWSGIVYNIAVDEDESYVAAGRVVHNCTEGPLAVYDEKLVGSINRAADEILAAFNR